MIILLRLLFFLAFFLPAVVPVQAASPYGRYYALVIGNKNYWHLTPLKTPLNDAEEVAKVLEKKYGFQVDLLLDADRDKIMRALSQLRRTMTDEKDNLLIYYAGHGYLDRMGGDAGYWQPVDAEEDNVVNWIPISQITPILKAIRAKHVLIVADSCYSGNLLMRDSGAQLAIGMEKDKWLQRMLQRRSRTALTSGGEEPVQDSGGGNHSVFAKALLEVLKENKGILDGDSLYDRIKRPVALNSSQTPHYGDIRMTGHEMGDFLLVPKELQGMPPVLAKVEERKRGNFATRGTPAQVVGRAVKITKPTHQAVPKQDATMIDPEEQKIRGNIVLHTEAQPMWSAIFRRKMNWNEARGYCDNYNIYGLSKWRLPTLEELEMVNKNDLGITDQEVWAEKNNKPAYFDFEFGHSNSGVSPDFSLNVLCIAD